MDIIQRALKTVDRLIVAVASNEGKSPLFSAAERVTLIQNEVIRDISQPGRIEVVAFDTLLMHFARSVSASAVIRGLRAVSDFEYEFQMASMNHRLEPDIETVFLMASDRHQFISSRFVKEIHRLGGDVTHFVSPAVAEALQKKLSGG